MRVSKCPECGKQWKGRRNRKFCSDECRYANWARTNRPSKEIPNPCVYCGMPASTVDHVPPQHARPRLIQLGLYDRYEFVVVNSCTECNILLGGRALWTVGERKKFMKKAIKKRYKKYLVVPDWSPSDIENLGKGLSEYVMRSMIIRDITIERIKY